MGLGTPTPSAASLLLTFAAGLLSKELFLRWAHPLCLAPCSSCSRRGPIECGSQHTAVPSLRHTCYDDGRSCFTPWCRFPCQCRAGRVCLSNVWEGLLAAASMSAAASWHRSVACISDAASTAWLALSSSRAGPCHSIALLRHGAPAQPAGCGSCCDDAQTAQRHAQQQRSGEAATLLRPPLRQGAPRLSSMPHALAGSGMWTGSQRLR